MMRGQLKHTNVKKDVRINASKENASRAIEALNNICQLSGVSDAASQKSIETIKLFLIAAHRKLPTEAAFKKDSKRTGVKS